MRFKLVHSNTKNARFRVRQLINLTNLRSVIRIEVIRRWQAPKQLSLNVLVKTSSKTEAQIMFPENQSPVTQNGWKPPAGTNLLMTSSMSTL